MRVRELREALFEAGVAAYGPIAEIHVTVGLSVTMPDGRHVMPQLDLDLLMGMAMEPAQFRALLVQQLGGAYREILDRQVPP